MNEPHFDTNALNKTISGVRLGDLKVKHILSKTARLDWKLKADKLYKVHYREIGPYIFVGGFFDKDNIDLASMSQDVLDGFEIVELD